MSLRGCDGGEGQKPPKTIQGYYFENIKYECWIINKILKFKYLKIYLGQYC